MSEKEYLLQDDRGIDESELTEDMLKAIDKYLEEN